MLGHSVAHVSSAPDLSSVLWHTHHHSISEEDEGEPENVEREQLERLQRLGTPKGDAMVSAGLPERQRHSD